MSQKIKKIIQYFLYEIAVLLNVIFLFTVILMDGMVFQVCFMEKYNSCSLLGIAISISSFFAFGLLVYLTRKLIKNNNLFLLIPIIVIFTVYFSRCWID